jgi:predicted transposase YdaD
MMQGMEQGMIQGMEQGMIQGVEKTARSALEEGLPFDIIQKITGLDADSIRSIQAAL